MEQDTQALQSLVEYLPTRSLSVLSSSTSDVKKLVHAIKEDDLDTVEQIISNRSKASELLIPNVLSIAALHNSRKVFTGIAPMMISELNDMLNKFEKYLSNLTHDVLKTDDPVIYEAFFSALDKTKYGAKSLLTQRVVGPFRTRYWAWYSYLGVLLEKPSGAYDVLHKYMGDYADPSDLLEAYENMAATPDMVKLIVESKMYSKEKILKNSVQLPSYDMYVSGEGPYEDVVKDYAKERNILTDMTAAQISL